MRKRLLPDDRKQEILDAALRVAAKPGGYSKLTRAAVAVEADCTDGLVSKYFGTMPQFKRAIMRAAIQSESLHVIAQGLACGDSCAQKAPPHIKLAAIATLSE